MYGRMTKHNIEMRSSVYMWESVHVLMGKCLLWEVTHFSHDIYVKIIAYKLQNKKYFCNHAYYFLKTIFDGI